jgi:hypothetical protein
MEVSLPGPRRAFAGGSNAPAATVCADVIVVFGKVSRANCSQLCSAPWARDTKAPLTASNATTANLLTRNSFPSDWIIRSPQLDLDRLTISEDASTS